MEEFISNPALATLITGPQWCGTGFFKTYYAPLIDKRLRENPNGTWLVGAAEGIDNYATSLLLLRGVALEKITIYTKSGHQDRVNRAFTGIKVDFVATSYPDRDRRMAHAANDIICVLPQYGGAVTGSLLPLLTFLNARPKAACARDEVLSTTETLRAYSEPCDEATAKRFMTSHGLKEGEIVFPKLLASHGAVIAAMYEFLYANPGEADVKYLTGILEDRAEIEVLTSKPAE